MSNPATTSPHGFLATVAENELADRLFGKPEADRRFLAAICTCGHPVILAVKEHIGGMDDEFVRDMMEACLEGCDLRHITYAEFRALPDLGCTCNDQPTLFDTPKEEAGDAR